MWVIPTDLVVQRVLFYAADKADYQLVLFLAKQIENASETGQFVSRLLRSSYSIVEAVLAGPLSLAVRKIILSRPVCSFAVICALLAGSYCALAFVRRPAAILVVRFLQASLLLMNSFILTQLIQTMQPPD